MLSAGRCGTRPSPLAGSSRSLCVPRIAHTPLRCPSGGGGPGRPLHTCRAGGNAAAVTLAAVYALLGLPNNAPHRDVRAAYRRMAAESHPDIDPSPNASNKFKV
jgi:hypothetical protein